MTWMVTHADAKHQSVECCGLQLTREPPDYGSTVSCLTDHTNLKSILGIPARLPTQRQALAQSTPSLTILPMQKSIFSQGLPERSSSTRSEGIWKRYMARKGTGSSPQRMASVP